MFDYRFDSFGGVELSADDGRTRYLQGEDAEPIRELDEWLDNTEFFGAHETAQDAIDTILDPYFADE